MRTVNIVLTFPKVVQEQKFAVKEEIIKKEEDRDNKMLTLTTRLLDASGSALTDRIFQIMGSDYDFLMSASNEFNPGKPENDYREEDIWVVIDKLSRV